jgi:hypothetical protein
MSTDPESPAERMTSRERSELAALVRRREKVAKTATAEVKARRLADLEVQLASAFSAEDERFADIARFASQVVARADQEVQRRCEEMGIPERFRPHLHIAWTGRGENATTERRAELRRVAQAQAEADQKQAIAHIEAASVEAQTALLRDGLTTDAARRFLDSLPTPEQLMPALEVSSLLTALPGHRFDAPVTERYSAYRSDWRLDRAALDELLGSGATPALSQGDDDDDQDELTRD